MQLEGDVDAKVVDVAVAEAVARAEAPSGAAGVGLLQVTQDDVNECVGFFSLFSRGVADLSGVERRQECGAFPRPFDDGGQRLRKEQEGDRVGPGMLRFARCETETGRCKVEGQMLDG